MHLNLFDWAIILLYIVLIFYSGIFMKKYVGNIGDFLVANRSMGFHLGMLSLMCTEIGMITYVYYAELGYKAGLAGLMAAFPPFIAFLILGKTGFIIKPLLDMKIMTIPEFYSKKFSKGVRFYVGLLMAVGGILNFGVFPGVEAKFINIVTGISEDYLLITMVVMLTLVLLYTVFGGMVSVIITNYLQYALLSFGMIFITVYGFTQVGWSRLVEAVQLHQGAPGLNPFLPSVWDSDFGLGFLVWQILMWISILVGWQAISMRLFSSKDTETGVRIYFWSALLFLARAVLPIFWGVMALAFLGNKVEPLNALPEFIVAVVPSGILGLIFAALLAASMSTYASYLLSWSSVVSQDIIGSIFTFVTGKEADSKKQLLISRITMALVMIFIIWWSLFHKLEGYLYFYLNMTAMLFIPGTLVSVGLGIYWKKSRTAGAYAAFTLGALPPLSYLILPEHIRSAYTSEMGWGGFVLALAGMLIGSFIQNWLQPQNKESK
ncbi:MAG TPA: sodium:solute symporter family protein [Caldithrix abyssi]|uniref:Sodium:solute symporter family protein n=1 Tax=Caldithrix abyssi TaxID=187145 RepID=A0A7V4UCU9_CALAY|nr:sodium:solute symporter family protein [Caldithrix abyssi]